MLEYILWFGLLRDKGKGGTDDIARDKTGRHRPKGHFRGMASRFRIFPIAC